MKADTNGMTLKSGLFINMGRTHSVLFALETYDEEQRRQELLPDAFVAKPVGHAMQERASCAEKVPGLHGWHFFESHLEAKLPSTQEVHLNDSGTFSIPSKCDPGEHVATTVIFATEGTIFKEDKDAVKES